MTLIQIYDFIKFIGNKDYNGNFFKPEHYKSAIIAANLDLYKKKSGLPEEYRPGMPLGREGFEINQKSLDNVSHFKGHVTDQAVGTGYFAIPANYVYWDSMSYNYVATIDGSPTTLPRPVEILTEDKLADRRGNWTKQPTKEFPVAVERRDAAWDRFYIFPTTINAVDFHYYRLPVEPVFSYTVAADVLTYDAAGSTEFEWPANLHMDLVRIMLSYLGINLGDDKLIQYAEMQKTKGV